MLISHAGFVYLSIFRIYFVEFTFTKAKKGCEVSVWCPLERCGLRIVSPSSLTQDEEKLLKCLLRYMILFERG